MQHPRPSRAGIVFLIGVPLAWAIVLLFHPTGDGEDFYPIVRDQVTAWMTVHVGTLLSVPLIAAVVYLLLRGVGEETAWWERAGTQAWDAFIAAGNFIDDVGVGITQIALAERRGAPGSPDCRRLRRPPTAGAAVTPFSASSARCGSLASRVSGR
jgi:hypothetical protein